MGGFNDPVIKMLQFGRNIAGVLRTWSHRRATRHSPFLGPFIFASSIIGTVYVSWTDKRNKRKLGEMVAENKILNEQSIQMQATFGDHKKEFEEFLQWKLEQKKAVQEWVISEKKKLIAELAEGNVPQDDSFTIEGQGDTFTNAGQGGTPLVWQGRAT